MKILFRKDSSNEEEFEVASKYFDVIQNRTLIKNGDTVIGRYSVLPYYKETEEDIQLLGGKLINTYEQHRFIANFEYYDVLKDYTPETWDDSNFYQCEYDGAFVVKGRTNSRKFEWDTMMYAKNAKQALLIASELMKDSLIGPQGVLYRKYIPLKTVSIGLNGLPYVNEWRFFFYKGEFVNCGYYWSCNDQSPKYLPDGMFTKALEIADIVKEYVNFFVIDMAETESGDFIMIEMNDGQMSGLSCLGPDMFYNSLKGIIDRGGLINVF